MLASRAENIIAGGLRVHSRQCVDCEPVRPPSEASLALQLRAAKIDGATMARIRRLVLDLNSPVRPFNDDQALNQFVQLLSSGRLPLCRKRTSAAIALAPPGQVSAPPAKPGPAFPLAGSPAPRKSAPPPVAEGETFEDTLDAAAIAAVLKSAAADGVPFCEECERARAARS
jgi:hypothetical protein